MSIQHAMPGLRRGFARIMHLSTGLLVGSQELDGLPEKRSVKKRLFFQLYPQDSATVAFYKRTDARWFLGIGFYSYNARKQESHCDPSIPGPSCCDKHLSQTKMISYLEGNARLSNKLLNGTYMGIYIASAPTVPLSLQLSTTHLS